MLRFCGAQGLRSPLVAVLGRNLVPGLRVIGVLTLCYGDSRRRDALSIAECYLWRA
jgi:hypothetical protein